MKDEIKILLVEDNPGDARLLREFLTQAGATQFKLTHIECLVKALEHIAEEAVDVVLLDLSLPDGYGLETVKRAHAARPEAPIVVLTGLDDEALAVQAVREGAEDYLVKGHIDSRLLVRALRYAIERKRSKEALRESEERYALAVRGAKDGLWDWNLKTNEIYFSPRWKAMLGCEESEIGNGPDDWFRRVHPEDLERVKADIASHIEGLTPYYEDEYRMQHKDGSYRWMLSRGLAVRDADRKAYRMAGSQTDVTDRNVFCDVLTGLPSRALFMDRLRQALGRVKPGRDYLFAVLSLDLDRFKGVNDSLGHGIGDQLLSAVARKLEVCLRPSDTVARLGGDEFAILLEDIKDTSDATRVAERIQKELSSPFSLSGHEVFTTASIGLALSATGYPCADDILRDADTAMNRAKALGKARYEMFDIEMHARAVRRLQLEADLRRALERQEFLVYYQPIVSLASGQIAGVEALLRWRHPERGFVSPAEFIPIAEETGLILPIGEWVLRTACAENKAWQDRGYPPLYVAVNLSAHQFRQKDLGAVVAGIVREMELEPYCLKLELTESTLMENAEAATATLRELKGIGVKISIDDFGTGYSSLSYLNRFPFDALKIDRSFVRDLPANADNATIVTAVITLGHSLKLRVVAEGVETEEQLAFLRAGGCNEMQGYLFSPPLPAEAFMKLWQEGRCLSLGTPGDTRATFLTH